MNDPLTKPYTISKQGNYTLNGDMDISTKQSVPGILVTKEANGSDITLNGKNYNLNVEKGATADGPINNYGNILHTAPGVTKGNITIGDNVTMNVSGDLNRDGVEVIDLTPSDYRLDISGAPYPKSTADLTLHIGNNFHAVASQKEDYPNSDPMDSIKGVENMGARIVAGDYFHVEANIEGNGENYLIALSENRYGKMTVGDHAVIHANAKGNGADRWIQALRIDTSSMRFDHFPSYTDTTEFHAGNDLEAISSYDGIGRSNYSLTIGAEGIVTIGDRAHVAAYGLDGKMGEDTASTGVIMWGKSSLTMGDDALIEQKSDGNVYGKVGINAYGNSHFTIGDRARIVSESGGESNYNFGIWTYQAAFDIGDQASFELETKGKTGYARAINIGETKGPVRVGNQASISVNTDGVASNSYGIYSWNSDDIRFGDQTSVQMNLKKDGSGTFYGYGIGMSGSNIVLGDHTKVDVNAENLNGADGVIAFSKGTITLGDYADIHVSGTVSGSLVGAQGSAEGRTAFGNYAKVTVSGETPKKYALNAHSKGIVTFAGAADISAENGLAVRARNEGSLVDLSNPGAKHITGDLLSKDNSVVKILMDTPDSYLKGNSYITTLKDVEDISAATTDISMKNGSLWLMTKDSDVTHLNHESGASVDMRQGEEYLNLHAVNYSGRGGIFKMKTDLDSQKDGDKVWIKEAEKGASGLIQVDDVSMETGKEVKGTKHLLVVTDDSKNAKFSGLKVDRGGLWDYTPAIKNGLDVKDDDGNTVGTKDQWYLTKIIKTLNQETKALISTGDNEYAYYRLHLDTLRRRLGDVRDRNPEEKGADIWARQQNGRYTGTGLSDKYHMFQLGADWAANRKSTYGLFFERGISNGIYNSGSDKDHSLAGAVYGLWLGDRGTYTDVIAKVGRNDRTLHTWGEFPDQAGYRSRYCSLSVEFGKNKDIGSGWYIEPQSQIVFGRLDDFDYTTKRGTKVHGDSYDSAIGRLGILIGRKKKSTQPYDYYIKANVYHEFGGDRDFDLAAKNGETCSGTYEGFGSTWYEAGLGGTWKLSDTTYIYGDMTRTFGGDLHEKWRWNVGINWAF